MSSKEAQISHWDINVWCYIAAGYLSLKKAYLQLIFFTSDWLWLFYHFYLYHILACLLYLQVLLYTVHNKICMSHCNNWICTLSVITLWAHNYIPKCILGYLRKFLSIKGYLNKWGWEPLHSTTETRAAPMLPQPTFRRTTHIKVGKETLNCNWHLRNPFSRSCPSAPLLVTCVSVRFMSVFLRMELDLISQENDLLPAEQLRSDYRKIYVLKLTQCWNKMPPRPTGEWGTLHAFLMSAISFAYVPS
jgi:hypothetical protein